jgi:hypothetical protein
MLPLRPVSLNATTAIRRCGVQDLRTDFEISSNALRTATTP